MRWPMGLAFTQSNFIPHPDPWVRQIHMTVSTVAAINAEKKIKLVERLRKLSI